jgi:hypothetical protein
MARHDARQRRQRTEPAHAWLYDMGLLPRGELTREEKMARTLALCRDIEASGRPDASAQPGTSAHPSTSACPVPPAVAVRYGPSDVHPPPRFTAPIEWGVRPAAAATAALDPSFRPSSPPRAVAPSYAAGRTEARGAFAGAMRSRPPPRSPRPIPERRWRSPSPIPPPPPRPVREAPRPAREGFAPVMPRVYGFGTRTTGRAPGWLMREVAAAREREAAARLEGEGARGDEGGVD